MIRNFQYTSKKLFTARYALDFNKIYTYIYTFLLSPQETTFVGLTCRETLDRLRGRGGEGTEGGRGSLLRSMNEEKRERGRGVEEGEKDRGRGGERYAEGGGGLGMGR